MYKNPTKSFRGLPGCIWIFKSVMKVLRDQAVVRKFSGVDALKKNHCKVRGFTLVELSISMAIMVIMMAIILVHYPETSVRLSLANVSHTTALLIREAQVRGSSIDSGNNSLAVESPIGGYGVYVSMNAISQLVLFADTVDSAVPKPNNILIGNGIYENNSSINETKSITKFPKGYTISKICVGTAFPFSCTTSNTPAITSLTISFIRPNPQPLIYINNDTSTNFSAGCIELRSPRAPANGHVRSIQFYNSGMIRTQIKKCDNSPS
jgi:prepilin-type N-terminal cleavage/methylation domain-containing protein